MTVPLADAAIEVFFSYAHEDEALRDKLASHLKLLERQGVIQAWHDRQILPGAEWKGQLDSHLETAQLILLLISSDFLASDYCYDIEMKRALERHEAGAARVIPIILRPVDWKSSPFSKLQALPKDGKAVTSWSNSDEAFVDIARGIRSVVETITQRVIDQTLSSLSSESSDFASSTTRRLDAAMPRTCRVKQRTEVRALIALPNSVGLKKYLPDWTESGDLISKEDVNRNYFPLSFPIDPVTGKPTSTTIFISITAPDFQVEQSNKNLYLPPVQDSGILTFFITPQTQQMHGRVLVEVYQDNEKTIGLGSLTLITEVLSQETVISKVVWKLASSKTWIKAQVYHSSSPSTAPPLGNGMTQHNYNGKGYQTKVTGGTVYIDSTHIHFQPETRNQPEAKTILFLAANPKETTRIRLDQEVRDIQEGLRLASQRDRFVLEQRWAVRPRDVRRAMLDSKPQIVHFSGHGAEDGSLALEDEVGNVKFVAPEALAGLFELFADQVECVLLNACYSEEQADAIVQHVPYVIGMSDAIDDNAALEFAVAFYDALGAGKSVEFAYKLGCNAIQMAGVKGHLIPTLLRAKL